MGAAGRCCLHWELILFQPCEKTPPAAPGGLLGWDLPSALPSAHPGSLHIPSCSKPPLRTTGDQPWPLGAHQALPRPSQPSPGWRSLELSHLAFWLHEVNPSPFQQIQSSSIKASANLWPWLCHCPAENGDNPPRFLLAEQICVCDRTGMGKGWMKGSSGPKDPLQGSRSHGSWAAGAVINKESILLSPIPQPVWLGGVQHD